MNLRQFGFNDICDIQEEMGSRYRTMKWIAEKKRADSIIKIHKLWEYGFPKFVKLLKGGIDGK